MDDLLPAVWDLLDGDPSDLRRCTVTGPPTTLNSAFPVTAAGAAAVGASLLAATLGAGAEVGTDTRGLAVALQDAGGAPHRTGRPDGRFTLATPPGTVAGTALTWPDPPPAFGVAEPGWSEPIPSVP